MTKVYKVAFINVLLSPFFSFSSSQWNSLYINILLHAWCVRFFLLRMICARACVCVCFFCLVAICFACVCWYASVRMWVCECEWLRFRIFSSIFIRFGFVLLFSRWFLFFSLFLHCSLLTFSFFFFNSIIIYIYVYKI